MAIDLSGEYEAVRQTARDVAQNELQPLVDEWEQRGEFPKEAIRTLAEYDLRGAQVPIEYDGGGMDMLSHAIVMEEVSKIWPSAGMKLDEGLLRFIRLFGTEEQKEKWLPGLSSGELLDAIALSEPDHGSDLAGITSTAERVENGYVLNGNKMWVTGGGAADLIAVAVKTNPGERHRGISIFLVPTDSDGVDVQEPEDLMGYHASNTHEVLLNDVFVSEENLLGKENKGFYHTMEMLGENRIAVAARGLGVAAGAYEESISYASNRSQFDQPIKQFQAIRHKIANMAIKVENCRHLVYNAAKRCDSGEEFETEAAMAKLYTSESAQEVASQAVQVHGGYGYTRDFPVEMHYRDAKGLEIYEGTSEIQRNIISDRILD
ncbi:acyl-CoA dehydrogenase family protein [Natrononativus amylolyticus]|uniref:acyl-CoA dehydrogenase family protein n=1 Tax=Natrononativus amylolyticus TaxID=2963434 RepID=UPI0020CDFF8E|nr:acyl-CoA dehydrogenase family protein [Natrononativus amylolyticus]